jgi:hypothetical protein
MIPSARLYRNSGRATVISPLGLNAYVERDAHKTIAVFSGIRPV